MSRYFQFCIIGLICFNFVISAVFVNTRLGRIQGLLLSSRNGKKFGAFMGVPYAQPPVGNLRLENPLPVKPWTSVLNATTYSPLCPQFSHQGVVGNEDCLYLNIYAPQQKTNSKLPVWLYIFGGRRIFGHAAPFKYGPEYLMDYQIILVTFAYRLGLAGYLSTEDSAIPGNYGLKDQSMALKWVREHIAAFGGDPTNVTLGGDSAGGVDSSLHLFSPLSKGLFHRCISQGGHPLNFWSMMKPGQSREYAWQLGKVLGCSNYVNKTSETLLQCLKSKSIEELIVSTLELVYDYVLPDTMFGPVIEHPYVDGAFLIENPADLIQKSINIPYLSGVTADEGSLGAIFLHQNDEAVQHFGQHYQRIFPEFFGYDDAFNKNEITRAVLHKYFNDSTEEDMFHPVSQTFGLTHAYTGAIETALQYKGAVFFYVYDYKNRPDYMRNYGAVRLSSSSKKKFIKRETGPVHGEEHLSLFGYSALFPRIINGDDRRISEIVLNFWVNFITSGNPNGNNDEIWQPVSTKLLEYLYISNSSISMKTQPYWEEYEFSKIFGIPWILHSQRQSSL